MASATKLGFASATELEGSRPRDVVAVLLALILGLSMIAAGTRLGAGLTVEGTALRDCVGGDQAWNQDAPGQPPPRLLDSELRKDSEDDSDSRTEFADLARELHEPGASSNGSLMFFERRSGASLRVREGHGARGPPIA